MEIKLANRVDIDRIKQIYYQCSDDMKKRFGLNHWSNPYPTDLLEKRIDNNLVYMVLQHRVQIGTFMLEKEYPQPYIDAIQPDDKSFRYLTRLAVTPDAQAKGIGSAIMKEAEKISKEEGATILRLDILENHEKLQSFYIKNGYSEIGTGKTKRFTIKFFEKEL